MLAVGTKMKMRGNEGERVVSQRANDGMKRVGRGLIIC